MEIINRFPASMKAAHRVNKPAVWIHHFEMPTICHYYRMMRKAGISEFMARTIVLNLLQYGRYSKTQLDWQREKRELQYMNSVTRDAF